MEVRRPLDFAGQRLLGLLSWRLKRRHVHSNEALEALVGDLRETRPDHVAVTGDLTNVATAEEFPQARAWLERLGGPGRVSVVPGNHDAYVSIPRERSWDLWSEYLGSDGAAPPLEFPTLRVRGDLALVGLSSALPTRALKATGRVGEEQLERLERRLVELAESRLCRVLLIHHPVTPGAVSPRRCLTDAPALRALLARVGAELVLHGHGHRSLFGSLPGPRGPIPVVGARSATDVSDRPEKRAQYHLYDVERNGTGFRIAARIRGYTADGRFSAVCERVLSG